jgi:hypothetical protein
VASNIGGVQMLFKPDEVTTLKRGKQILVEIKEGDVRVLKRNFCGVYELFKQDDIRNVEYFEDLTLFKNRYGGVHKKFPLYNLSRQRLDIYPIVEHMSEKDVLKWFSEYGTVTYSKKSKYDDIEVHEYNWISDTENTLSKFQIARDKNTFVLSIAVRNSVQKAG